MVLQEENKEYRQLLEELYQSKNYKIKYTNAKNNRCIVFFSSNGLFYPNTKECVENVIVKNDRYEWENIAEHKQIRENYSKIIFCRDLRKQWYVTGINDEISCMDELIEFLKHETAGMSTVMVGDSSGGYIATLMGVLLQSECVYNISGQYGISDIIYREPLVAQYANEDKYRKYYDIKPYLMASNVPIWYFMPAKSKEDQKEYQKVADCENIFLFAFDLEHHGESMVGMNYSYIFAMPEKKLHRIFEHYNGKMIHKWKFFLYTVNLWNVMIEICKRIIKK